MIWLACSAPCKLKCDCLVRRLTFSRYTEEFMAELATKAMKHWDALEKDAGVSLRWMGGLLNFGDKDMGGDTPEGK